MAMYQSALTGPQMDAALLALNRHDAEAWSVGTRGGEAVPSGDPTYMNNAKYYAEQAAEHGGGGVGIGQNLLDNWYFGNPINQRGQESYTGESSGINTIDRWSAQYGLTIITNNTGHVSLVQESGTGYFSQRIENPSILNGRTLTASVLFSDGTLRSGTITRENGKSQYFVSYQNGIRWYMGSSNSFTFEITSSGSGGNPINIVSVKLEFGSRQTLAHQENGVWVPNEVPNYTTELLKCQRYLYVLSRVNPQLYAVGTGFITADGSAVRISFTTPTPMRVSPSVVKENMNYVRIYHDGVYVDAASSEISAVANGNELALIVAKAIGANYSNHLCNLVIAAAPNSTGRLLFSAEL